MHTDSAADQHTPGPLRIGIAGAGAIGCTIAARLGLAGHHVNVLARGATLTALQRDGIVLRDLEGQHQVAVHAGDGSDFGVQDVLFLSAKAHQLIDLLPAVLPLIGPNTLIVPTVNGVPWWYFHHEGGRFNGETVRAVDPDGRLSACLPLDQIIGSVVFISAEAVQPGQPVASNPHLMMLGELNHQLTPRLQTLCAVLSQAGIEARPLERIRDKLWTKIIANISTNPLSVVSRATLEELYRPGELQLIVRDIMRETLQVAASYGARVEIDPLTFLELGEAMGAVRTSMLQDYERGRALELAAIGDAVLELAERFAIPMPVTRHILGLARHLGTQTTRPA
jgi:2-dehydropantoate 2-reductase